MSEGWDEYAEGWDTNEAVISYCLKAYDSLVNKVELEGRSVLDFGCGTGLLTEKISAQANYVVAIDPSEKMISVLTGKGLENVRAIQSELTQNLIDTDESLRGGFDIIVASSALAFVPDYLETLKLLKQLLKKEGSFVQWDWLQENEISGSGFSRESIELALKQAGYSKFSTSLPFSMESSEGSAKVVMAVARNV